MPNKNQAAVSAQSTRNVIAVNQIIPNDRHADRVHTIRQWHIDQAISQTEAVAAFHLAITADGRIKTSGVAIEPEHAMVMLAELDTIRDRLTAYLVDRLSGHKVVPLRR